MRGIQVQEQTTCLEPNVEEM